MKQIIYTVLFLVAIGLTGCQKAEYLLFNDIARGRMVGARDVLSGVGVPLMTSGWVRPVNYPALLFSLTNSANPISGIVV